MTGSRSFSGGVFANAIEGGRVGTEIEVGAGGLTARTRDGQIFSLDYVDCQLEMGGASGQMLFCRNPDRSITIFCEDRAFPQALAEAAGSALHGQLDALFQRRRQERRRGRIWGVVTVSLVVMLVIGGYLGIKAAGRSAVRAIPVSVDKQIGKLAIETMDLQGETVEDPVIVNAVQAIVDRLEQHADGEAFSFSVQVVDAPIVNAFALPGGPIVVYTGLIEKADTAQQVAGVLAHEMAHVTQRHGIERIAQSVGLILAVDLLLGDTSGLVALSVELLESAAISSYSRGQEAEADKVGVVTLHEADIRPTELASFFEMLEQESGDMSDLIQWLASHPSHENRVAAIHAQVEGLPAGDYTPLQLDWKRVRRHAAALRDHGKDRDSDNTNKEVAIEGGGA